MTTDDSRLTAEVRRLWQQVDPPPAGLVEVTAVSATAARRTAERRALSPLVRSGWLTASTT